MPIYYYECPHCSATKETFKKFKNLDDVVFCDNCCQPMTRTVEVTAFVLKGDNWAAKKGY